MQKSNRYASVFSLQTLAALTLLMAERAFSSVAAARPGRTKAKIRLPKRPTTTNRNTPTAKAPTTTPRKANASR